MIKSMTGFGRMEQTEGDKTFLVELKALNGKQLDIQLKLPPILRPYEVEIRNILQEKLLRGSLDCFISVKQNGTTKPVILNTDLIRSYFLQIKDLTEEFEIDASAAFASLLRLPEVVNPANEMITEDEFESFRKILLGAIDLLNDHRVTEGKILEQDILTRVENIKNLEQEILQLEPKRMERIKEEINSLLSANVGKENIDNNRMEQELIYYMEKIDIHEEQIRLKQHCDYFKEIVQSGNESHGKKLSFVLQEIGREINTTGSKAYDAGIQKHVVEMKDELEKAKEQVLNIL